MFGLHSAFLPEVQDIFNIDLNQIMLCGFIFIYCVYSLILSANIEFEALLKTIRFIFGLLKVTPQDALSLHPNMDSNFVWV